MDLEETVSGRPYTYGRAMAIAQLMRDRRRPAIKEIEKKKPPYNKLQEVYLHGEDLYVSYQDTIDWVPKLTKLTRDGHAIWGIIDGWPTEEEIAAEIAASAEREKNWNGSLSANDFTAVARMAGIRK